MKNLALSHAGLKEKFPVFLQSLVVTYPRLVDKAKATLELLMVWIKDYFFGNQDYVLFQIEEITSVEFVMTLKDHKYLLEQERIYSLEEYECYLHGIQEDLGNRICKEIKKTNYEVKIIKYKKRKLKIAMNPMLVLRRKEQQKIRGKGKKITVQSFGMAD